MALVLSLADFNDTDFFFSALEDRIEEQRRERERLCWRTEEVQNVSYIMKINKSQSSYLQQRYIYFIFCEYLLGFFFQIIVTLSLQVHYTKTSPLILIAVSYCSYRAPYPPPPRERLAC
jgi:hypothetical protein